MPGRSAFNGDEVTRLLAVLETLPPRDRALMVVGINTGLRVSELCGLRIGQVWDGAEIRPLLVVPRRCLKGGCGVRRKAVTSRALPLNAAAAAAIAACLMALSPAQRGPRCFLFASRKGQGPLSRWQANRIVHHVIAAAGLPATDAWGTHSLRKTFCQAVYVASGHDLVATRTAMGHAHATTTEKYLAANEAAATAAIREINFGPDPAGRASPTGSSVAW